MAVILVFIGIKMLIVDFYHIPIAVSLGDDWKASIEIEIDHDVMTEEKLHQINNFWSI